MSTVPTWIVCEQTGRWAAALRFAFAKQSNAPVSPRVHEVRSLDELIFELSERRGNVGLVEVRLENLPLVLDLITAQLYSNGKPIAALLDDSLCPNGESAEHSCKLRKQQVEDLLHEAGAVDVIESPRRLERLLQLRDRLANQRSVSRHFETQSVTEWAYSLLPWQDD